MHSSMFTFSSLVFFTICTVTGQRLDDSRAGAGREPVYGNDWTLRYVRPAGVGGDGAPVRVDIGYVLNGLIDVNRHLNHIDTVGYLQMSWKDPRLAFPTTDSNWRTVDVSEIWTPDIELFNAAAPGLQYLNRRELAKIGHRGFVLWIPQVASRSLCNIPSTFLSTAFNCTLRLGSWTYDGLQVDLVTEFPQVNVSSLVPSQDWTVVSASLERKEDVFECCSEPYISVEVILTIRHH